MAEAARICPKPGCPRVAEGRHCPEHNREYEKRRGTRQQRGYGADHTKLRAQWARRVQAGIVTCARCGMLIDASSEWSLDHDDDDRSRYIGPSHRHCNDSAGGKNASRIGRP